MIAFDADVLIAYLDGSDAQHEAAVRLLEQEADDEFIAGSLTLAEVLVGPARSGRLDDALTALWDLEVAERDLPAEAAVALAQLRATTGLRMPDCCVLLTAQDADAQVASFDQRVVKAAKRVGLTTVRRRG